MGRHGSINRAVWHAWRDGHAADVAQQWRHDDIASIHDRKFPVYRLFQSNAGVAAAARPEAGSAPDSPFCSRLLADVHLERGVTESPGCCTRVQEIGPSYGEPDKRQTQDLPAGLRVASTLDGPDPDSSRAVFEVRLDLFQSLAPGLRQQKCSGNEVDHCTSCEPKENSRVPVFPHGR